MEVDNLYQFDWHLECDGLCRPAVAMSAMAASPEAAAKDLFYRLIDPKGNSLIRWENFVLTVTRKGKRYGRLVLTRTLAPSNNMSQFVDNSTLLHLSKTSHLDDRIPKSSSVSDTVCSLETETVVEDSTTD